MQIETLVNNHDSLTNHFLDEIYSEDDAEKEFLKELRKEVMDYTEDFIYRKEVPNLTHLKDHLRGIADAFYKTGNIHSLENSLDECFHVLGMKLDQECQPVLEKKGFTDLMQWYIGYQYAQKDQLRQI